MKGQIVFFLALISASCSAQNATKNKCGPNETYVDCLPCAEMTCYRLVNNIQVKCMPLNPCPGGCICIDGYARDDNNKCVPTTQCKCPDPNAMFVFCPTPCPLTCDNYLTPPLICPAMCLAQGCTCKKGYVLNTDTGKCVKPAQCKK